ncbi:MAG: redox-sensing transcriptional repressor Rex [Lutisporaceae bacterium]
MQSDQNMFQSVSKQTLQRLPLYLNYLKTRSKEGISNISAPIIADSLNLNEVQVRKDLALVSSGGRPKTGYRIDKLIADIKSFLGYDNVNEAILVGAGQLGKALLSYKGFDEYGLNIVAALDIDEELIGSMVNGKQILSMEKMNDLCKRLNVHMGIITVPAENAQLVCNMLIESGILAIWNFSPVHLNVPEHILVQNENIATSLAVLSKHLIEKMSKNM